MPGQNYFLSINTLKILTVCPITKLVFALIYGIPSWKRTEVRVRKSDFDKPWQFEPELLISTRWALEAASTGADEAVRNTRPRGVAVKSTGLTVCLRFDSCLQYLLGCNTSLCFNIPRFQCSLSLSPYFFFLARNNYNTNPWDVVIINQVCMWSS